MDRKIVAKVECQSGYSSCDHPNAVWWLGQRHLVKAIMAEWRTPIEKHYRLLVPENMIFHAAFHMKNNSWNVEKICFENIK